MRQQCLKKVIDIGFRNVRSGFMPDRTFAILFLYCLYWIYRKPYDIMKQNLRAEDRMGSSGSALSVWSKRRRNEKLPDLWQRERRRDP